jgi:hypothetical protein
MLPRLHKGTPGRRSLRGLSTLLVLLFLLGQLAGSVHLAVVQHRLCPDDGELTHASQAHAAAEPPGAARLGTSGLAWQPGCDCTESHQHEHCFGSEHRHERPLRRASLACASLRAPPTLAAAPAFLLRPSPKLLRLFRVAPKNSPPV